MEYKTFLIFWLCGANTFSQVSSKHSDTQYIHQNKLDSETRTRIVPLLDDTSRVKRDANSTDQDVSITAAIATTTSTSTTREELVSKALTPITTTTTDNSSEELKNVLKKELEKVGGREEDVNKNLQSHKGNLTFDNETHKYYKHTVRQGENHFYDLDQLNTTGPHAGRVKQHNMLSQSYRRAATINLSFKFPFYGHQVENITIATGGFLYTGDYVHSWLAATQYIAPLMANFDTSKNYNAKIRYLDDRSKLIVEWKDVHLQEKKSEGSFTFQVILFANGNITFAYHTIPIDIINIMDEDHPVKVGLSDAYIIDRTVYFARRKTIYEYHRVTLKDEAIKNKTAILFDALPTCNTNTDCQSCVTSSDEEYDDMTDPEALPRTLECRWCAALSRCSDGTDRNRQEWLKNKCDNFNVSKVEFCHANTRQTARVPSFSDPPSHEEMIHVPHSFSDQQDSESGGAVNPGGVVVSVFICMLLLSFSGWLGYAYFNPNTASGRFLIKYRPGAWRWRQSGARYTAASIHM